MATINGQSFNPFYRPVDADVQAELNRRAAAYGARVRSGATTPSVDEAWKGLPEATKILWSYGKTAYALITGGGITLGSSYSRIVSDRNGNLTLYDSTRNQPKYPLLQSVELTSEGQLGSLLKGSFTFTVYPDLLSSGFNMNGIEEAFFTPGKEVKIVYGWSVRDGGVNNGSLTGIIYNFDWSVNTDLSITAKCSIVSKATIAIGVSGEQTTPASGEAQTDPLGQPIPNGDLAGVIEWDVKNLGGANNKSVSLGQISLYDSSKTASKKLNYYVIGMPMSLVDLDNQVLNQQQQQQKQQYQNQQKINDEKNQQVQKELSGYENMLSLRDKIANIPDNGTITYEEFGPDGKSLGTVTKSKADAQQYYTEFENRKNEAIKQRARQAIQGLDDASVNDIVNQVKAAAEKSIAEKKAAASGTSGTSGNTTPQTTQSGPYGAAKAPPPVTQPIYYVKLGDLTEYINKILADSPLGKANDPKNGLFQVQCFGNTTEHMPKIVSSAPEEVFFPDEEMGTYGSFAPFGPGASQGFLKYEKNKTLIDISAILISTTAVIRVYRNLVKENQTSIEYKNITAFFDELIKLVNYASGEMYQLTTQLIDPPKGGEGKAILSIEDSHISKAVMDSVEPNIYKFEASIAKPILKSISISCKPPAASAAATFTLGRGGGSEGGTQTDVRFDKEGNPTDSKDAEDQIIAQKKSFITQGAGKTFSTGLKGNYSKFKRSAEYNPQSDGAHWLRKVIYPIDLSLTIDGIDGFKFGDVISTNLIPKRYNEEKMVFVVTKISHTIQNGVWETTLNTKSRIEPQSQKAG